jgi:hypothetical protein
VGRIKELRPTPDLTETPETAADLSSVTISAATLLRGAMVIIQLSRVLIIVILRTSV